MHHFLVSGERIPPPRMQHGWSKRSACGTTGLRSPGDRMELKFNNDIEQHSGSVRLRSVVRCQGSEPRHPYISRRLGLTQTEAPVANPLRTQRASYAINLSDPPLAICSRPRVTVARLTS